MWGGYIRSLVACPPNRTHSTCGVMVRIHEPISSPSAAQAITSDRAKRHASLFVRFPTGARFFLLLFSFSLLLFPPVFSIFFSSLSFHLLLLFSLLSLSSFIFFLLLFLIFNFIILGFPCPADLNSLEGAASTIKYKSFNTSIFRAGSRVKDQFTLSAERGDGRGVGWE